MKLRTKILSVALLTFLTLPLTAQGVSALSAPSSDLVPTLVVDSTADGWTTSFTGMGSNRFAFLMVGSELGRSSLDFGRNGTLLLDVRGPVSAYFLGTTDVLGSISIFIPRPKTLPPQIEGMVVALQGVSIDPSLLKGAPRLLDFVISNPTLIRLISVLNY
jgi:hypothetical protein